jgi:hypothetical protein
MTLPPIVKWLGGLLVVALVIAFVVYWTPVINHFTLLERRQEKISYEERQAEFIKLFAEANRVDRLPPNYEKDTDYKKVPPLMIATPEENAMFRVLNALFTQMIAGVSAKHNIPITVDRTIYDIYHNSRTGNVIFDGVVIVTHKEAEVVERYFLKVLVKYTSPTEAPQVQYVSIDFPTEDKLAGSNARTDEISEESLETKPVYEIETERILGQLYTLNKVDRLPPYKTSYIAYPKFTKFLFGEFFKENLLRVLKDTPVLKSASFEILRDIYDIHYLDTLKDRDFVFSVDLFDKTTSLTIPLVVYVTIPNIDRFLTGTGDFSPDTRKMLVPADFILKRLERRTTSEIASQIPTPLHITFEPTSKYDMGDYYRFRSKLNLLGPTFEDEYTTMKITPEMEEAFKEKVTPQTIQKRLSMCFNRDGSVFTKDTKDKDTTAVRQADCEAAGAIWDSPPVTNAECPFYKANVLYPNNFGRIIGNGCELPRGMQKVGYRRFSEDSKYAPLCYNCKDNLIGEGTLGYCCDAQAQTMLSPDYAFNGDTSQRFRNRELLERNGLSIV